MAHSWYILKMTKIKKKQIQPKNLKGINIIRVLILVLLSLPFCTVFHHLSLHFNISIVQGLYSMNVKTTFIFLRRSFVFSNLSNYLSYNGFPQCIPFLINNKCKQPSDFLLERRGCEVDDNEKRKALELKYGYDKNDVFSFWEKRNFSLFGLFLLYLTFINGEKGTPLF